MFISLRSEEHLRNGSVNNFTASKTHIPLRMKVRKKTILERTSARALHTESRKCAVFTHGRRPE